MLIELGSALGLGGLLLLAVWQDVTRRRIPNKLVLAGLLIGFAVHLLLPRGDGLFASLPGSIGILASLGGAALALVLLLPMYALGTLGAGDVKLMAVVGAWLGPLPAAGAILLTMLAGGVLALGVALVQGALRQVLRNVWEMLLRLHISKLSGTGTRLPPAPSTTGKLPYAVAICCGTLAQLLLAGTPVWTMFS